MLGEVTSNELTEARKKTDGRTDGRTEGRTETFAYVEGVNKSARMTKVSNQPEKKILQKLSWCTNIRS